MCSLDEDRRAALDAARLLVTQYLGQQPHIMKASGVPESLLEEISKVLTWPATAEQVEAASKLVPDDIVQMITASGTAAECQAKVAEYVQRWLHLPDPLPSRRERARHDRRLFRLDRLARLEEHGRGARQPSSSESCPEPLRLLAGPCPHLDRVDPRGPPVLQHDLAVDDDLERLHARGKGEVPRVDRLVAPTDTVARRLRDEVLPLSSQDQAVSGVAVTSSSRWRA